MPLIKPDIVFFGESLPEEFHDQIAEDKLECDLLIVMGSSLKVRPVSLIPSKFRRLLAQDWRQKLMASVCTCMSANQTAIHSVTCLS